MGMRIGERVGLKFDPPLRVAFFDIGNVTELTDTLIIGIFLREFYCGLLIRDIFAHTTNYTALTEVVTGVK